MGAWDGAERRPIEAAQTAIRTLKATLEEQLLPLLQGKGA